MRLLGNPCGERKAEFVRREMNLNKRQLIGIMRRGGPEGAIPSTSRAR
jgi:hypothetical protein